MFKGQDGGAAITALSLDMSNAGTATFNNNIKLASDASEISFGADADVSLTHYHNVGLILKNNADYITLQFT